MIIDICGLDRRNKRFKMRPTPAPEAPYWAIGRIKYKEVDREGKDGWLLYLKSGLHGTEPMDVLISYTMGHPRFPHGTTANQFFTESQFESYRMPAFEIVSRVLESGDCPPPRQAAPVDLTLEAAIENLEAQCEERPRH
jgi:hypothetical protein